MPLGESAGKDLAIQAAKIRWNLPAEPSPLDVRQAFLRRIAAQDFHYDERLVAELKLLTNDAEQTAVKRRLLALGEREYLGAISATYGGNPGVFKVRAKGLHPNFDSLLSRRFHEDWLAMADAAGGASPFSHLEFEKPPATRRPSKDLVPHLKDPDLFVKRKPPDWKEPEATAPVERPKGLFGRASGTLVVIWLVLQVVRLTYTAGSPSRPFYNTNFPSVREVQRNSDALDHWLEKHRSRESKRTRQPIDLNDDDEERGKVFPRKREFPTNPNRPPSP